MLLLTQVVRPQCLWASLKCCVCPKPIVFQYFTLPSPSSLPFTPFFALLTHRYPCTPCLSMYMVSTLSLSLPVSLPLLLCRLQSDNLTECFPIRCPAHSPARSCSTSIVLATLPPSMHLGLPILQLCQPFGLSSGFCMHSTHTHMPQCHSAVCKAPSGLS